MCLSGLVILLHQKLDSNDSQASACAELARHTPSTACLTVHSYVEQICAVVHAPYSGQDSNHKDAWPLSHLVELHPSLCEQCTFHLHSVHQAFL